MGSRGLVLLIDAFADTMWLPCTPSEARFPRGRREESGRKRKREREREGGWQGDGKRERGRGRGRGGEGGREGEREIEREGELEHHYQVWKASWFSVIPPQLW